MARKACHSKCTQEAQRPPKTALPTDLRVEFNHRACKLLLHNLIEIVFVGIVINELLALHNFSLEPKEKHVREQWLS